MQYEPGPDGSSSTLAAKQPRGPDPETGFIGRQWVFDHVDSWITSGAKIFVIVGPAGSGKSAIAARLVEVGAGDAREAQQYVESSQACEIEGSSPLNAWLTALHACSADDDVTRNPLRFVEAVSAQLADRVPGFAAARDAAANTWSSAPISVRGYAHAGSVSGWNVGALVQLPNASAVDAADVLLRRPLEALADLSMRWPPGGPVVLVDALDEALGYETGTSLPALIGSLSDTGLRFLITTRPDNRVLEQLSKTPKPLDLIEDAPAGVDDVGDYVKIRLPGSDTARLAQRITSRAAGNFLYARYVLDDLVHSDPSNRPDTALADADDLQLPTDLAGIYHRFLTRELLRTDTPETARNWTSLYQPLLSVLAIAFDPGLTPSQLATLLPGELTTAQIRGALERCRQYVEPVGDAQVRVDLNRVAWRIYHQSFREYLRNGPDRITDTVEAHAGLADALYIEHHDDWGSADSYARAHFLAHCLAALRPRELSRKRSEQLADQVSGTVCEADYLITRISRDGPDEILREGRQALSLLPPRSIESVREVVELLMREADPLARYRADGATFVAQQLHNQAVGLGQHALAVDVAGYLDQSTAPHARLRWRAGADLHLVAVLAGHTEDVNAVVSLPDGRLASAAWDNSIRIWDPTNATDGKLLAGHTRSVEVLVVLGDGRLASGARDGTVRVWDTTGDAEPLVLTHADTIMVLAELSDGRLASGSSDSTIRVWDPTGAAAAILLRGHSDAITALQAMPDGRLASGSWDSTIRVWDLASGAEPMILVDHTDHITALAMLPDGRLVSASSDETIRIWDSSGRAAALTLNGYNQRPTALAVLPDGRLASASGSGVWLWDIDRNLCTWLTEHTGSITALAVLGDGRLASAATDGTVRVTATTNETFPLVLTGHVGGINAMAVLLDGRLASASADRTVRLWDTTAYAVDDPVTGHRGEVTALALLPDGRLASAATDYSVRIWDITGASEPVLLLAQRGRLVLAALPDGRLACGGEEKLQVWDLANGMDPVELEDTRVDALAVLPDGGLVFAATDNSASASSSNTIRFWDPGDGYEPVVLTDVEESVSELVVLPNGRLASRSDWDETVSIWDTSGSTDPVQLVHTSRVTALALSADGRLATTCHDDLAIWLWNPAGGLDPVLLTGHTEPPKALSALPDGRLVSGSYDFEIRVWHTTSHADSVVLTDIGPVLLLAALPDGRAVSGTFNGGVRVWDTDNATSVIITCPEVSALATTSGFLFVGHTNGWVSAYELIN